MVLCAPDDGRRGRCGRDRLLSPLVSSGPRPGGARYCLRPVLPVVVVVALLSLVAGNGVVRAVNMSLDPHKVSKMSVDVTAPPAPKPPGPPTGSSAAAAAKPKAKAHKRRPAATLEEKKAWAASMKIHIYDWPGESYSRVGEMNWGQTSLFNHGFGN